METEEILAPVLAAVLNSDLIGALFRQVFPAGTAVNVPIDPIGVAFGPASATLCPGGCGAKVTIRNLAATADGRNELPIRVRIVLDVSVRSHLGGARAPLPLVTSGGDLAIDIDTSRGSTDLKFVMEAIFSRSSSTTPEGFFRVNPANLPSAMRFTGVAVDIGEIFPVPGFELEADDLDFQGTSTGGRAAAQVINYYEAALVPYMRAMIHYSLNTLLCTRFGTECRELVMPEFPDLTPRASPIVLAAGLATLLLGGAYLWRKKRRGLGFTTDEGNDDYVVVPRNEWDCFFVWYSTKDTGRKLFEGCDDIGDGNDRKIVCERDAYEYRKAICKRRGTLKGLTRRF